MRQPNPVTHKSDGTTLIHIVYKAVPFDCVIDTEDYPKVAGYRWHIHMSRGKLYVEASRMQGGVSIHRLIMGFPKTEIDHKNGDALYNRQQNLRLATHTQNCRNRKKRNDGLTSKYKGVCLHKKTGKWQANMNGIYLGLFNNQTDAAIAYNEAALAEHGAFALLNQIGG
jgi:hypothetical protein